MADIGEKVLVHCVGTLDDGREVENTRRAGEPLAVTIGAGRLPGALEGLICNMLPGDRRTARFAPEQLYGMYDEQLVQTVPVQLIPNAGALPVGGYIELGTKMGPLRAKVVSVGDDAIVLDCNHELAGQAITYDVEMISIVHDSAIERELHPAGCACGCHKLKEQLQPE